jgi:RND family efflux transporter MFP subunit
MRIAWTLAALLLLGGCEVPDSDAQAGGATTPPPTRVAVALIRDGVLRDKLVFLGEARPLLQAELGAAADAEITEVTARVGDRVKKGDVLVRLDPRLAAASVAAARASRAATKAEFEQAERDRERSSRLTEIMSKSEIERDASLADQLGAQARALRAQERRAKAQLHRYAVIAPFDGVVQERNVDPGDWVAPGDTVLVLVDDERVEVIVAGSADLVQRVQTETEAVIRLGTKEVPARVEGIVRALDPTTRTARLRLVPESTPSWLLPGLSVDVAFEIEHEDEGVIVPRDAIVYGVAGNRIVVVRDGKAEPVSIEVVAAADAEALVRGEGLSVGEQVVVRGNERLRPGQPVAVEEHGAP